MEARGLQGTRRGLQATAPRFSIRDPRFLVFPGGRRPRALLRLFSGTGASKPCIRRGVGGAAQGGPASSSFTADRLTPGQLPLGPWDTRVPLAGSAAFPTRPHHPGHAEPGGEREGRRGRLPGPSLLELLTPAAWSPHTRTLCRGPPGEDACRGQLSPEGHHPQLPWCPMATSEASGPDLFFLLSSLGFFPLQIT